MEAKVCLLTMCPSKKDKRTFKEALLLAEHGLRVIILGPKRLDQEEREQKNGVEIIRVPFSPRLRLSLQQSQRRASKFTRVIFYQPAIWLLKAIEKKFRKQIYFIKLLKIARGLNCNYYHAHFPLSLMIIAKICASTTHGEFFGDFNDIINRKRAMERQGKSIEASYLLYYEQEEIWGKPPNEIDIERIKAIKKLIPIGVKTILDAGCGDGKITNELARSANCTIAGFDISEEALSYVQVPKFRASIDHIPMPDQAYDLVICTEVLEHLPPVVYKKALQELARLSKKYILIELPHRQQLAYGMERCSACGAKFHCNHHYRSCNAKVLRNLFGKSWKIVEMRVVGGPQFYYHPLLLRIRQTLGGVWAKSPIALCSRCGTPQFITGYRERNAISGWCDDRNIEWRRKKEVILSQVIVLYRRESQYESVDPQPL
jgi:SAM-dependent methyltransferase